MNSPRQRQLLLSLVTLVLIGATALVATARSDAVGRVPEAWVGTWSSAPEPAQLPAEAGDPLATTGFDNQSIREVVRTSAGGSKGRLRLTNLFGMDPLTVGHVSAALPLPGAGPGDLRPGSIREVTFNGHKTVIIPGGGGAVSDPIDMAIPAGGDVAITIYVPGHTGPPTFHLFARASSFVGPGDTASSPSGAGMAKIINNYYFLSGLDVLNRSGAGAVAVMGDSITDAIGTKSNTNARWTNFLAARLNKAAGDQAPGVLNLGISGNRLGHHGEEAHAAEAQAHSEWGVGGAARFVTDVLGQTGVRAVIVELGINDIWMNNDSPDLIIGEMQQLASLAHRAGIKIFMCTLSPWNGLVYNSVNVYSAAADTTRLMVNSYLRTTSDFDGIIDFDGVLRDPGSLNKLRADVDSGDHIHPNPAGNQVMADAVPLDWLLAL